MGERIPGTNPDWNRNLPDGYNNSLVDENGNNYDNGFNFDEKDDGDEWDKIAENGDAEGDKKTDWENMSGDEDAQGGGAELSKSEQVEVDFFKEWYAEQKQKHPEATEDELHTTIVSGLGYHLSIPGYRLIDVDNPDAKPTDEQQTRLEELYGMVVGKTAENTDEKTEEVEDKEIELSDSERTEVSLFKTWYANAKQNHPDATEDDLRRTIISGLGYNLDIPGYGLGDSENPDAKPTDEQQARLEELYGMVVGKEETSSEPRLVDDQVATGVETTFDNYVPEAFRVPEELTGDETVYESTGDENATGDETIRDTSAFPTGDESAQ